MAGRAIALATMNGPVRGSLDVTQNLSVKTCNGPVKVTVMLKNDDEHIPTKLALHTDNGYAPSCPLLLSRPDLTDLPRPQSPLVATVVLSTTSAIPTESDPASSLRSPHISYFSSLDSFGF